jgi:MOSC domain-containing protein YiiM
MEASKHWKGCDMLLDKSRSGRIAQVSVSRGGVPKLPVAEAIVTRDGIITDAQSDRRAHGHDHQALCLWSIEQIGDLRMEGHDILPGSTGENITTENLEWAFVVPGAQLLLGDDVIIEVTDYASPCWKNARWFKDGDFNRINEKVYPGSSRVYARVLQGGTIRPGDPIRVTVSNAAERVLRRMPRKFKWPQDFPETLR